MATSSDVAGVAVLWAGSGAAGLNAAAAVFTSKASHFLVLPSSTTGRSRYFPAKGKRKARAVAPSPEAFMAEAVRGGGGGNPVTDPQVLKFELGALQSRSAKFKRHRLVDSISRLPCEGRKAHSGFRVGEIFHWHFS